MTAHLGVVMHQQAGMGDCYGEFNNPANGASSTWWVSKAGAIVQYVDDQLIAWTQAAGNATYNSIEFEGGPEALTNEQLLSAARIYVYGVHTYRWPLALSEIPGTPGFIWHGAGGAAWGGHLMCPGDTRKAQRVAILYIASLTLNPPAPTPPATSNGADMFTAQPDGKGYRIVKADGSVWCYGSASYHGGLNPGAPVGGGAMPSGVTAASITTTPTGAGYWIVSSNLSVYCFGDAPYLGHP